MDQFTEYRFNNKTASKMSESCLCFYLSYLARFSASGYTMDQAKEMAWEMGVTSLGVEGPELDEVTALLEDFSKNHSMKVEFLLHGKWTHATVTWKEGDTSPVVS